MYRRDVPERVPDTDEIDLDRTATLDKHTIWERKLLDLSLRNNLINIHTKKGVLQLLGSGSEEMVAMLENGAGFHIFGIPPGWRASSVRTAFSGKSLRKTRCTHSRTRR